MVASKTTRMVGVSIVLLLFCLVSVSCKSTENNIVNTKENPQEWTHNDPRVVFTTVHGDSPHKNAINSVLLTRDGGYVLAGSISENKNFTMNYKTNYRKTGGGSDGWLIKTDSVGKEIWNRPIVGQLADNITSAQQTADGGYIIAGWTETAKDETDGWLVKADSEGNPVWMRTFACGDYDTFDCVQQTNDGGCFMAGWTIFPDDRYQDGWVVKTDNEGKEAWSHNYGNTKSDLIHSAIQCGDGGYILAGQTISAASNTYDGWIIKIDTRGKELWSRTFGGDGEDNILAVKPATDGGYILAGYSFSGHPTDSDGWLIKIDSNGKETWSYTFNTSVGDKFNNVQQTRDGGYILAGCTGSKDANGTAAVDDAWVVKTDEKGKAVWSSTYGGKRTDSFTTVLQTSDGGYILAGWASSTTTGEPIGWLMKLNGDGH